MPQVVPVIGDIVHIVAINPRRSRDWEVIGQVVQIVPASEETRFFKYPGMPRVIRSRASMFKFILKKQYGGWSVISYLPEWYSFTVLAHSDVPIFALIPQEMPPCYERIANQMIYKVVDEVSLPEPKKTIYDADY